MHEPTRVKWKDICSEKREFCVCVLYDLAPRNTNIIQGYFDSLIKGILKYEPYLTRKKKICSEQGFFIYICYDLNLKPRNMAQCHCTSFT